MYVSMPRNLGAGPHGSCPVVVEEGSFVCGRKAQRKDESSYESLLSALELSRKWSMMGWMASAMLGSLEPRAHPVKQKLSRSGRAGS